MNGFTSLVSFLGWIGAVIGIFFGAMIGATAPQAHLTNLLGISNPSILDREAENLSEMLSNTAFTIGTVLFLAALLTLSLVGLTWIMFLIVLLVQVISGLPLWIFITSKIYPKIPELDFSERFRAGMTGKYIIPRR
jgi:hypothetical protein